ncbi:NAD(+) diphosphatase [Pseudorhodobacter sp.]|uniref:NAD(+) diphosphatase n=1 Tax=Pseudorhodobacter sp. TaxID=1934400 RepID=UPI0026491568|nr:NAD(+) diphosphatase [Pseudorhodobacter sp.]MDN5787533.1 NAD(+) diphosphatase [Pseudorhodobacter sp.]
MNSLEMMSFVGSGLDRAAELRGDTQKIAAMLAQCGQVLPIWRGKPLIANGVDLGWLRADHPVLEAGVAPIFLGLDGGIARFAQDISDWLPPEGAQAIEAAFFDSSAQFHPDLPSDLCFLELRGAMMRLSPREGELVAVAKAVIHWHRSHRYCAVCGEASVPINAGWQRHCAACSAQHFPRTDPVVIMLVQRGNRLLLGRSPGWPAGMYSCLAGFVEPGESIEAAVRREVVEETGISVGVVRYVACQPWPFPTSLMIGCAAEALDETITLDPKELEDALWLTREEMLSVMAGEHPTIRPARKGAIAHHMIAAWLADRLDEPLRR